MEESLYNSSLSGFMEDSFEGLGTSFTDFEVVSVRGNNVLVKAKRYGRWWMLKGLTADAAQKEVCRQLLRKEFEILISVNHPGVVSAVGFENVSRYGNCIVMEYVEGLTLSEWLSRNPSLKDRRRVARLILDAVEYLHSINIIHRDLKPSNILVAHDLQYVKIIDFGLADTDSHAVFKQPAGTIGYMSPEQFSAVKPDIRNDIYALGGVLLSMKIGYERVLRRCLLPIDSRIKDVASLREAMRRHRKMLSVISAIAAVALLVGILCLFIFDARNNARKISDLTSKTDVLKDENLYLQTELSRQIDIAEGATGLADSVSSELKARNDRDLLMASLIERGKQSLETTWKSWDFACYVDTLSSLSYFNPTRYIPDYDSLIHRYIDSQDCSLNETERAIIFQALKIYSTNNIEIPLQKKLMSLMETANP